MTLVSLKAEKSGNDGPLRAEFSDGSSLIFTAGYLPDSVKDPASWEAGRELNHGEEAAFEFAAACYRAEKIALKLIARAEQNSLVLMAKLERRRFDSRAARAVISSLQSRNLLDDGRYAKLWLRFRLSSGKALSPRWLLAALVKKGIDRESSRVALREVLDPEAEYALLLQYLEKAGPEDSESPARDNRQYLKSRMKREGFSSDVLERYFD